jgi:tetratricopeptide (TPR) repeat protein
MDIAFDVFLSHNSRDKPAVRKLWRKLQELGLRPWLDEEELPPGRSWQQALDGIIRTIPAAAVLVGGDGLGPWEVPEMEACLAQLVKRGVPVIPVLLPRAPREPDLPVFLGNLTWVDLREGFTRQGLERLVYGITGKKPVVRALAHPEGSGPRLHNLPFPSLRGLFHGREKELAGIEEALATGSSESQQVRELVLYGLGGIGKTQLAVEHAWRVGDLYRAVFFVRGESAEGLQAELASLAGVEMLDLPARRERAEGEVASAVLRWLRENPGWLLIIDNADTEESAQAVAEWLPRLQGGQVMVTSRIAVWPVGVETREVLPIPSESAVRFLIERTAGTRQASEDDSEAARALAEKLGGLPLALEQAAAYLGYHRMTLRQYLSKWEESGTVLGWYNPRALRYPRSLAVTWQTTIERLSPGARALLRLAAHLAADPIPVEMLAGSAEILEAAVTLDQREDGLAAAAATPAAAIAELAAYSMLERGEMVVSVHRLVQEVTRARIPKETRREWAEMAVRMVTDYAPKNPIDVRTWPRWSALRPHASEVIGHADRAGISDPTFRLANQLGLLLQVKALYRDAEPLLRRALDLVEGLHGAEHVLVATPLDNLALLLLETNQLAEAEPLMRRALASHEAAHGPDHPEVAVSLNNLAVLFLNTNRMAEAELLMRRAVAIDEAAYGSDHPEVATDLTNLAMLLKETNRVAEAEPLMRRALVINEAVYGPEHPRVANVRARLSTMAQAGGSESASRPHPACGPPDA